MKTVKTIIIGAAAVLMMASCKKEVIGCMDSTASNFSAEATKDNASCVYTGTITFWYNSNQPPATVKCDGNVGTISSYYINGVIPSCGAPGCATFIMVAGVYDYTASNSKGLWSGKVTVPKNGCGKMLLNK